MASMAWGLGPMKAMPSASQPAGEAGVLRQEAEAGMDGLGARSAHGLDDLVLRPDRTLAAGDGPMWMASSAISTAMEPASASE